MKNKMSEQEEVIEAQEVEEESVEETKENEDTSYTDIENTDTEQSKKKGKRGPKTEAGLQAVSAAAKQWDHSAWTRNPQAVEAINVARRLRQTKNGLYSSVPIICKADQCPYAHSCPLIEMQMAPYAEKCPIEIAALEDLFSRYLDEMNINPEDKGSTVDMMLVKDLVDADIGLLRIDNKMAWDADYVIDNVIGLSEDGEAITKKELHPLTEYKEKLIARKNKTMQLLNSTRKDKAGDKITLQVDPSERAAEMMRVQQDMAIHYDEEAEAEKRFMERMKKKSKQEIIEVEPILVDDED